jgi:hypothetical protein
MKAISYIVSLMLLILGSCTPTLYTGAEYDDLYYSASDKPVVKEKYDISDQVAEKELKANNYYDNIYSADTLVTDKYSVPSDYDDQIIVNNNMGGSGYDYYDNSYANRINMFYGNSFYPYWHDPFYFNAGFNYGYPYFGFGLNFGYGFGIGFGYGYGGYPYYGYSPYYYDPYYYYGGGYYGCCNPYYGGGYYQSDSHSPSYGRRERPSSMSSSWNDNLGITGSSRRNSNLSGGGYSASGRRTYTGTQATSTESRRTAASKVSSYQASDAALGKTSQDVVKSENAGSRTAASTQRTQVNVRPDYKNANRTYTPSYNNPRMSTRPSYNNSRVSENLNRSNGSVSESRNFNNTAPVRNSQNRIINQNSGNGNRGNSFSNMQRRYSSPSSSSKTYSVPSRRSGESSGRSYSSGSFNKSSSGSGSSGSYSRSSYSSGSSSGSSSRSSSTRSSGGRR